MTFAEAFVRFVDMFPKEHGVPAYYVARITPDRSGFRYESEDGAAHAILFRDSPGVPIPPSAWHVLVCVMGTRHTVMAPLWPIGR